MKARKLRAILNNTAYIISNKKDCISVGSPYCSDLISVNKETLKVKYALDTFREGRKALENSKDELLFIWDKLHELIASNKIQDIINGKDVIENPLPVYSVHDGQLIESFTDKYGYPNTDDNGVLMYDNTHYDNPKRAIEYGMNESSLAIKMTSEAIQRKQKEIDDLQVYASKEKQNLENYKILLDKHQNIKR